MVSDRVLIKYNDESVKCCTGFTNNWLYVNCNSELIIEPGVSTLQITYKKRSDNGNAIMKNETVVGYPWREIILSPKVDGNDDTDPIVLKLSSSDICIPLYALTCHNVY